MSTEIEIVGYLRASPEGKPEWSEDCVCVDAVYPNYDGDESVSMPICRLADALAVIAQWDARVAGAERCAECGTITARLDGDGCAKWCCHCGARLNGDYVNAAALKAQQPSAGVVDERTAFDAWFDQFGVGSALYPESTWQGWQARARLNPCRAQAVACVACEGHPMGVNNPCAVCGGAQGEAVAWMTGPVVWSSEAHAINHARAHRMHVAPLYAAPPASATTTGWRCYHCDEHFNDSDSATLHFGTHQHQSPACLIDVAEYRAMEARMHAYNEEDAEIHRAMARMHGHHRTALQREEEKGYARGLKDGATPAFGVIVPRELLELCFEGFDDHWITLPEGMECTQQLRALLARSAASAAARLVPVELLERIDGALTRHMDGHAPMRVPVAMMDSDIVQAELRALLAQSQEG